MFIWYSSDRICILFFWKGEASNEVCVLLQFCFNYFFFLKRTKLLKAKLVPDLRSNWGYFGINLLLSFPCDPTEIPLRSSVDLYRRQCLICNNIWLENRKCFTCRGAYHSVGGRREIRKIGGRPGGRRGKKEGWRNEGTKMKFKNKMLANMTREAGGTRGTETK